MQKIRIYPITLMVKNDQEMNEFIERVWKFCIYPLAVFAYFGQMLWFQLLLSFGTPLIANLTSSTNSFTIAVLSFNQMYQNKNNSSESRQCTLNHTSASESKMLEICLESDVYVTHFYSAVLGKTKHT